MTHPFPDIVRLMDAIQATWPPAEIISCAGWQLCRGLGGGQRVSAARGLGELSAAEKAMRSWGQTPLFCVTPGQARLDAMLEDAGYIVHDPVVLYAGSVDALIDGSDETAKVIRCSTPLMLVDEIWERGGIDSSRRGVMARAAGPKAVLMSRVGDRPSGCAFVACDREICMLHALEVRPEFRRQGSGARLMHGAASWARENGAETLALAVTEANTGARTLYRALGMAEAGRYHYRKRPEDD